MSNSSADEKFTPKGCGLSHVTNFEILEPLYIFGTLKNRNSLFVKHDEHNKS